MIAYDHNKENWQQKNACRHQSATVHCRGHEQIVGQPDKNIFIGHLICSTCAFWAQLVKPVLWLMLSSISGRQLETVLTVCLKLCNKLLNYGTVFWPHKCFGAIQLTQTYTCLVVIILYLKMIYHVVVVPGNDFEIANYYPWYNLFFSSNCCSRLWFCFVANWCFGQLFRMSLLTASFLQIVVPDNLLVTICSGQTLTSF